MKTNRPDPAQMTFDVILGPPSVLPVGDGGYIIKPGRPIARLTTAQAAAQIGVSASSIRRYIAEGLIPHDFVECAGKRKFLINSAAIPLLKSTLFTLHLDASK